MMKKHVPIPVNEDEKQWADFINSRIPLIESTSDERGLNDLREKVLRLVRFIEQPSGHSVPTPGSYEGRLPDYKSYVLEHLE